MAESSAGSVSFSLLNESCGPAFQGFSSGPAGLLKEFGEEFLEVEIVSRSL